MNKLFETIKQLILTRLNKIEKYHPPYMLKRQYYTESIGPFHTFQEAREHIQEIKNTIDSTWNLYVWNNYPLWPDMKKDIVPTEIWKDPNS